MFCFVCHSEICMPLTNLNDGALNGRLNGIYIFNVFDNILCKYVESLNAYDCFYLICVLQSHPVRVCAFISLWI